MEEVRQLYEGDSPLLDTVYTEAFVRQQLSRLRETLATGPDGIYARLLKRICIYISEALANIFNSLLQHSKVPPVWLDLHITPIYRVSRILNGNNKVTRSSDGQGMWPEKEQEGGDLRRRRSGGLLPCNGRRSGRRVLPRGFRTHGML